MFSQRADSAACRTTACRAFRSAAATPSRRWPGSQPPSLRAAAGGPGDDHPECGRHLVGYFLAYEVTTNDVGSRPIAFDSLASYEAYKAKLRAHPQARADFAAAHAKRFILREECTFVQAVDRTFGVRPK